MLTPVPATLPDSTLAPADVLAKFSPVTLAGLGRGFSGGMGACGDCLAWDEFGQCSDTDMSDCTSGGSNTPTYTGPPALPVTTTPGGSQVVTNPCDPGFYYVPSANGCLPTAGLSTTVGGTAGSAASLSPLLATLLQGGVNVAELNAVKPGTTLTAGGITQQSAGFSTQGTPAGGVVAPIAGSSMTMLLLLAVAGVVLFSMEKGK